MELFKKPTCKKLYTHGLPKYKLMHENGCGGIAFYFFDKPKYGEIMKAENALLPNGEHPEVESPIICYQCGGGVCLSDEFLEENK